MKLKNIVARLRPRPAARLTIEPPKPVSVGWLIRLRCHNPGRPGSFEATVATVRSGDSSQPRSWHVPWRHHERCLSLDIPPGGSELLRLAIFRPNKPNPELVLLEAIDGNPAEIRHPLQTADGAVVTVRIRPGRAAVMERRVRLAWHVGDNGELVPDVAFVS